MPCIRRLSAIALLLGLSCFLAACGHPAPSGSPVAPTGPPATSDPHARASELRLPALPADGVQPWEKTDSSGRVIPATPDSGRARLQIRADHSASALSAASLMLEG